MTTPTFGQAIKQHRKNRGLTQKQAAALVGVKTRTWQQWEYRVCKPRYASECDRVMTMIAPAIIMGAEDTFRARSAEMTAQRETHGDGTHHKVIIRFTATDDRTAQSVASYYVRLLQHDSEKNIDNPHLNSDLDIEVRPNRKAPRTAGGIPICF